jgi:hypothetical protein
VALSFTIAALVAVSSFAQTTPADYLPCTVGLTIEYRFEATGEGHRPTGAKMTETIRGAGREPNTCVVDREVIDREGRSNKDAWAREMLADRISNAGYVDQPVAFRPPMLRAPIERAKTWRFNTTEFEIEAIDEVVDVPAGRFTGCVRVREWTRDHTHSATSVYARDAGLILYESRGERYVAVRVTKPNGAKAARRGDVRRTHESPNTSKR